MVSRIETLLKALINGTTITGFRPQSRSEEYLLAAINHSGTKGLPNPQSRLDALLYLLVEISSENHGTDYYNEFWDTYQNYGARTVYSNAFRYGWTNDIFKPKYDIKGNGNFTAVFSGTDIEGDLEELLNNLGVKLDTSQATELETLFYNATKITRVGTIDTRSTSKTSYMFEGATALKTIDKVILKSDGSQPANMFKGCNSLENIVVDGMIGSNINLSSSSKLTVASAKSIINALKNYSGTGNESKYTVKFHADTWTALEASGASPFGTTWKYYVQYTLGWGI